MVMQCWGCKDERRAACGVHRGEVIKGAVTDIVEDSQWGSLQL